MYIVLSIKLKKNHTHNMLAALTYLKHKKSNSHTAYLIYVAISVEIVLIASWIIMV